MRNNNRGSIIGGLFALGVMLTPVLLWLTFWAGVIYTAVHFIRKFW